MTLETQRPPAGILVGEPPAATYERLSGRSNLQLRHHKPGPTAQRTTCGLPAQTRRTTTALSEVTCHQCTHALSRARYRVVNREGSVLGVVAEVPWEAPW